MVDENKNNSWRLWGKNDNSNIFGGKYELYTIRNNTYSILWKKLKQVKKYFTLQTIVN